MKSLLIIICSILSHSVSAASIIYYESKEAGEVEFRILHSSFFTVIYYDESDKEILIYNNNGGKSGFKVDTKEEALEIIRKIYDYNDKSFIELELS